ncbi:MAG: hypothetical protein OES69_14025 [Myxococcales bacterium]|nr:hypothetical protein [Myxococcales bacterium]
MSKNEGKQSPQVEQAFQRAEQEGRPADYPGLTPEHRKAASTSQFFTFLSRYWPDWRHTKVRMYRFLLEEREQLLARERERLQRGSHHPETIVYQEITNGLIAAAASEVCQYAEDLGVLVSACDSDEFFAQKLAGTRAGSAQDRVKGWKDVTDGQAAGILRIPFDQDRNDWEETDPIVQDYVLGLARARNRLREIGRFYRDWELHFMRYKHGLLLGLSEPEVVEQSSAFLDRRRSSLSGAPFAFDCAPISQAIDQCRQLGLIIANVDEDHVRWNISKLAQERNLLRLVLPSPLGNQPDIWEFERISSWISQLQLVLLWNRARELDEQHGTAYYMPAERADERLVFTLKAQQEPR